MVAMSLLNDILLDIRWKSHCIFNMWSSNILFKYFCWQFGFIFLWSSYLSIHSYWLVLHFCLLMWTFSLDSNFNLLHVMWMCMSKKYLHVRIEWKPCKKLQDLDFKTMSSLGNGRRQWVEDEYVSTL